MTSVTRSTRLLSLADARVSILPEFHASTSARRKCNRASDDTDSFEVHRELFIGYDKNVCLIRAACDKVSRVKSHVSSNAIISFTSLLLVWRSSNFCANCPIVRVCYLNGSFYWTLLGGKSFQSLSRRGSRIRKKASSSESGRRNRDYRRVPSLTYLLTSFALIDYSRDSRPISLLAHGRGPGVFRIDYS